MKLLNSTDLCFSKKKNASVIVHAKVLKILSRLSKMF